MLRILAKIWAKLAYRFKYEKDAGTFAINARLAERRSAERRTLAEKLTTDAETIEANIKSFAEKEERGFWECENGHESEAIPGSGVDPLADRSLTLSPSVTYLGIDRTVIP